MHDIADAQLDQVALSALFMLLGYGRLSHMGLGLIGFAYWQIRRRESANSEVSGAEGFSE